LLDGSHGQPVHSGSARPRSHLLNPGGILSELGKKRLLIAAIALACGPAPPIPAQDCNCNGQSDAADIAGGTSSDCNRNGIPDECELERQTRFTPVASLSRPGQGVRSLAILDLDGDGRLDLAIGSKQSGSLTLLVNGGGRTLRDGRELRLEAEMLSLAAADLDGDGAADLAACIPFAAIVLLGDRQGGFRERRESRVDSNPIAIAAVDLDGDGDVDLVTANSLPGNRLEDNVSVLLNAGRGDFTVTANYASVRRASALVVDDLDGDGVPDIAVAGRSGAMSILRNLGGGAFVHRETVDVGFDTAALSSADLDLDGAVDLVAGEWWLGPGRLAVLLNAGPSFQVSWLAFEPGSIRPAGIAARDLDGDGEVDLVAAGLRLALFRNLGEARFGAPLSFATSCIPAAIGLADLDGDGAIDLALAGSQDLGGPGCVELLWNDGKGGFGLSQSLLPASLGTRGLQAADLDLDGDQDLVVPGPTTDLYHNEGGGVFTPSRRAVAGSGYPVMSDLDRDGRPDLAAVLPGKLSILWGEAGAGFVPGFDLELGEAVRAFALAAADIDGDGKVDLCGIESASGLLWVFQNRGGRRFELGGRLPVGRVSSIVLAADLDGDGREDFLAMALAPADSDAIIPLWSLGGLAFEAGQPLSMASSPAAMRVGDIDGDGRLDLIACQRQLFEPFGEGGVRVYPNLGGRRFGVPWRTRAGWESRALALADLDADGDLDLAVANGGWDFQQEETSGSLSTFANRGDGRFEPRRRFAAGMSSPRSVAAADFDGDGSADLAWTLRSEIRVELRITYDPWRAGRERNSYGLGGHLERTLAADLDGDGRMDLVTPSSSQGTIAYHRGLGDFLYDDLRLLFAAGAPATLASADLDGDGRDELLCADLAGVVIVIGAGEHGGLRERERASIPPRPRLLAATDLDGDGDLDLVVACDLGSEGVEDPLAVFSNAGDGSLGEARLFGLAAATLPASLAAADLDGDGRVDLAISGKAAAPRWLRNAGGGGLEPPRSLSDELLGYGGLAAADLDGDGAVDLILGSRSEVVLLGNEGGGRFARARQLHAGGADAIEVLDADGDGVPDLLLGFCRTPSSCSLFVRWSSRDGEGSRCGVTAHGVAFGAFADLDGDGHVDLIRTGHPLSGVPALTFLAGRTAPPAASDRNRNGVPDDCEERRFHRGDATGDGRIDLADSLALLSHLFLAPAAPACLDAADADGDGALTLSDPLFLLLYLFRGGAAPPPPGPPPAPCGTAGKPPGAGGLGCSEYEACS
jgi:hypothetical protein